MKLYVYMRKNKKVVSLNPEYGIEVSTLTDLAEKVKNDNPELYSVLVIVIASILGNDEKKLVTYCNTYLSDAFYDLQYKNVIKTDSFNLDNDDADL
jgi:hypothetical protein